ncbi:hypothetical protein GGI21_003715 [Coemansia aciculifera]|nr:hypothetical protein GGI21_003715 [Coemansia aciculifera]
MPATPASGSATPMSRDDTAALLHQRDYDGESEAEDVEMQDDETESEEALENQVRATSDSSLPYPTTARFGDAHSPAHVSSAAVATPLPDSLLKPPPMAKPAAVNGSTAATGLSFDAK